MELRENFRNFLNDFSKNLQRESDRKLSENKALTEYVQSPEGQRASTAVGLGVASLLPIPGAKTRFANQMANIMNPIMSSGARVGRDVVGRAPMPMSKAPVPTNRGPRGNTNIEQPTQGNLNLRDLKDTGITSLTNRMNPKMRNDLLGRRDRIQQDVFRMDSMRNAGEPVDMNKLFRLQDELDALNKTLK